jgi:hypothetical protein
MERRTGEKRIDMDRWTRIGLVCAGVALLGTGDARGDVLEAAPGGFTVRTTLTMAAVPSRVYDALLRVGSWWDPQHTYSGDAANLSLDARPGGCFCERLVPEGGVQHATVVLLIPNKTLRLVGGLGPLQEAGVSGSLTFQLAERVGGTDATLNYSVGGSRPGGLETLAPIVDSVLAAQLKRLKSFVEKGTPAP